MGCNLVIRVEKLPFAILCSYNHFAYGNCLFLRQQDSVAEAEGIEKMAANAASVMNEDAPNTKKDN